MPSFNFWDIPITVDSSAVILPEIKKRLAKVSQPILIFTPNPDIMLTARQDELFGNILRQAAFNIPDGTGLIWALRKTRPAKVGSHPTLAGLKRISGIDFLYELLNDLPLAQRVALLGANAKSNAGAVQSLKKLFPRHAFRGWPGEIKQIMALDAKSQDAQEFITPTLTSAIAKFRPTVILVGLGAPLQEKWLWVNAKKIPTLRVAMGVGGAFDMISGLKIRAPVSWRKLGLEWLWRLILEPKRWRRILRATLIFPLTVLRRDSSR